MKADGQSLAGIAMPRSRLSNAGPQRAADLGPAWTERPPVARHSGGKGGPELLAGRPFVVHGSEIGQSAYSVPQFDSVRGSRS